ncbi:MAG TPA: allantoate amidohydrolase [Candidatus Dormibacteraeota bacterium]|nr:allantoate amidohydrolase [Candidatus Dormibacteraeota bacterium]
MSDADTVMERCDVLANCSEEAEGLTRPFASEAMRQAQDYVSRWMREAGMTVRRDNIGNLRARYEGDGEATLLLGSHLDSVRRAGKYDGPLGVMVGLAAVQRLRDSRRRLPFSIELIAFADEEGLRFGSTYLGSRAVAGTFDLLDLDHTDAGGTTMADAIRAFGGDPARIAEDREQGHVLGYCEVHIEQGPVLEARGLQVGVVSGIAGQNRFRLTFTGEAGHAGTVPMDRRRDALVVAAMYVIAVEHEARNLPGLVATVGDLRVPGGAANVIPGRVELSLDVRHVEDGLRLAACERLIAQAHALAGNRGVTAGVRPLTEDAAVPCAPRLVSLLSEAVEASGHELITLPSGAGHDGVAMSSLTDIGMLFVRCKGGISHSPAESVETADVAVAIDVLGRFLELVARQT